jgi:hypothetical protein
MRLAVDEIRAHIERILQSKTFETSEVHRRLLNYLAVKTLTGEADRLKAYAIGLEAFGKPATYDPRHDSIVRLQVGRLRQKLLAYYQSEASGDTMRVTLPKGGFRLEFHSGDCGQRCRVCRAPKVQHAASSNLDRAGPCGGTERDPQFAPAAG